MLSFIAFHSVDSVDPRSRKCLNQRLVGYFGILIGTKNMNVVEDVDIVLPDKFLEFRFAVSVEN